MNVQHVAQADMVNFNRATAIHRRMHAWRADLEERFARAQLLVALGAPDPNFDALADEIATFRYCIEALVFSKEAA